MSRTEGLQPWRRLFHAGCGISIVALLYFMDPSRAVAGSSLGGLAIVLFVGDVLRLRIPALNRIFFLTFRPLASPREADRIASSTWYVAGCFLAVVLFPRLESLAGILALALADPAASYAGRRWGAHPWGVGTVEGSLVFGAVSLAILVPLAGWAAAVLTATVVSIVERARWPLDDNLTVPVSTAAVLAALRFLGV